jgi:amino acid permease
VTGRRVAVFVAVVIGLVLIAVGIVYFTVQAKSLPSFIPGHLAGATGHRTKRGIAALVIGVLFLGAAAVFASMGRPRPQP